ncbi:hypothetical protein GCM10027612_35690 [Microbispora bryophytorum subsp. camponoti]
MDDHLIGWLTGLDEDRLARVLANRPDAIAAPWPRRLDALAQRLTDTFAVMEVMRGLPLPLSNSYRRAWSSAAVRRRTNWPVSSG